MDNGKHSIIILHGAYDASAVAQSELLYRNIAMQFQKLAITSMNKYFQLVHIAWQSVLHEAETALFTKAFPHYTPKRFYTFWDALTPDQSIRNFMTFFLGDVIAYTAENNNRIRNDIWKQMQPVCLSGSYSIVAHSMGSVIAFDYLYKLFNTNILLNEKKEQYHRAETDAITHHYKQNFHHLFTMGSPLALFTLRRGSLWEDPNKMFTGIRNPVMRAEQHHPLRGGLKRVWMNFYDKKDYLAYPLRELFSTNPLYRHEPDAMPIDEGIEASDTSGDAHTGYWSDKKVAAGIAEILAQTVKVLGAE